MCTRYAGSRAGKIYLTLELSSKTRSVSTVDGYKIAVCRAITSSKHLVNAFRFNVKKAGVKNYRNHFIFFICTFFSFFIRYQRFGSFLFELRYTLDGCSFSHLPSLRGRWDFFFVKQTMADVCWCWLALCNCSQHPI